MLCGKWNTAAGRGSRKPTRRSSCCPGKGSWCLGLELGLGGEGEGWADLTDTKVRLWWMQAGPGGGVWKQPVRDPGPMWREKGSLCCSHVLPGQGKLLLILSPASLPRPRKLAPHTALPTFPPPSLFSEALESNAQDPFLWALGELELHPALLPSPLGAGSPGEVSADILVVQRSGCRPCSKVRQTTFGSRFADYYWLKDLGTNCQSFCASV